MMFAKYNPTGFISPINGIEMKTFVYGENSLLTRFHLKKGSLLLLHSHPQEQTGFMISGKMKLYIGKEAFTAEAGDSWSIKGGIEHRAEILEDSMAIEVFSPLREDYLPVSLE
ncbi:MAG: cupin domain-containing protein [Desulfobacula sp.]|jgi:quercetin dioxygenase-like cupin family protein